MKILNEKMEIIGCIIGLFIISISLKGQPNNDLPILNYPDVREVDVLWKKEVWRVIDTRQKINLPFRYPKAPFIKVLLEGIKAGAISAYSPEDDNFSTLMGHHEILDVSSSTDTVVIFDLDTNKEMLKIVQNDLDFQDIKKYRLKEVWYFDSRYSILRVQIKGIAPLKEDLDEMGDVRFERPLFWVQYPDCRHYLANNKVYNPRNDKVQITWADQFEMRLFSSYIIKESNVFDQRLEDYLSGTELLREAEKIELEIFNYEHDLWSY